MGGEDVITFFGVAFQNFMDCCTYKQNCLQASVLNCSNIFVCQIWRNKNVFTANDTMKINYEPKTPLRPNNTNISKHCKYLKKCSYQMAADTHAKASLLINLLNTIESLGHLCGKHMQTLHVAVRTALQLGMSSYNSYTRQFNFGYFHMLSS